jgi:hypothetical protein
MSGHDDDVIAVEVKEQAWKELFVIIGDAQAVLYAWAIRHDLTPSIMVGAAYALGALSDEVTGVCQCELCGEVPAAFVDEFMARVDVVKDMVKH